MKCPTCRTQMTSSRENYRYTESGLPLVTLIGVEIRRCTACGEVAVAIPRIDDLHRSMALAVATKRAKLMKEEIKFLRKYLGWSGVNFAKHMGVSPEHVSRWENGASTIGDQAERTVRLMAATRPPVSEYPLDTLAELEPLPAPLRLGFKPVREGWTPAELAA